MVHGTGAALGRARFAAPCSAGYSFFPIQTIGSHAAAKPCRLTTE
jgi:hypothetical protein